jgi:hypothetical protein
MKIERLNKSTALTSIDFINRTIKKKVAKIILKMWVQKGPSSVKEGSFFVP